MYIYLPLFKYNTKKSMENYQIDKVDIEILSILMEDSTIPYTEVAKKVLVSPGTIHVRMNKLKEHGLVEGSTLLVNTSKLGLDVTVFIGVFLEKGSVYKDVVKKLAYIPEVVEAHYTTGQYSIFLKVVCRNTQHLRDVLNEKIQGINGINGTETIISLEESIKRPLQLDAY